MLCNLSLRRFSDCSSSEVRHSFPLVAASGYYLPEGRYYDAPAVLRRMRRKPSVIPAVLGMGFLMAGISSLQPQVHQPLVAAATTVLVRSVTSQALASTISAAMPALVDPMATGAISPAVKSGLVMKTAQVATRRDNVIAPDEERIRRYEKTAAVIRRKTNNRPSLISYRMDRVFVSAASSGPDLKHIARLVSIKRGAEKLRIKQAFIPALQKKQRPQLPVPKMLASLVNNDRPDILALGYAPADISRMRASPFDSILNADERQTDGRFIPPVGPKDHGWAASPVPVSTFSPVQQKCLAEAIYFESRGESLKGQVAVAQVVLNRVRNPAYPDTVCGVVYQNVRWYNRCQFSFACDGKRHRVTERRHWRIAQDIARAVTAGQIWLAEVGSSTHYHAVYVRPQWAGLMDRMQKIGQHIFYRTRGGGWS